MRSGSLRHRVKIEEVTETADGMGGTTNTWTAKSGMHSVPAAIWPLSSKEQLDAMKLESVVTNKIRLRYQSGLTSKDRIVFGTRVFNIVGTPINKDEKNLTLDLLVTEDV